VPGVAKVFVAAAVGGFGEVGEEGEIAAGGEGADGENVPGVLGDDVGNEEIKAWKACSTRRL
jgi:hypothetical protein